MARDVIALFVADVPMRLQAIEATLVHCVPADLSLALHALERFVRELGDEFGA